MIILLISVIYSVLGLIIAWLLFGSLPIKYSTEPYRYAIKRLKHPKLFILSVILTGPLVWIFLMGDLLLQEIFNLVDILTEEKIEKSTTPSLKA